MAGRTTYQSWFASLPIPWLVAGPNGQAEAGTWPALLESETVRLDSAAKASFPDLCPSDALSHVGGEAYLRQGNSETSDSFKMRCKDFWGQWSRAGTWCGLLEQLYYFFNSYTVATIVQQNGKQATLTGAPTPGQDPTSLVSITNTSVLAADLTSSVYPYRTIPAGTPWWVFDSNTDLCNRFAVLLSSWPYGASEASALKTLIMTFRPNALCMGVGQIVSGNVWGQWTWGTGNWGGSVTTIISGAF